MAQCVVTGGGGFIGAYLARALLAAGWSVTVVDNLERGDQRRLASVMSDLDFQQLDIRDEDRLTDVVRGCEVVFHLAAINGTENFYTRPELVLDVGLRGALAVVGACRRAGVHNLVVASSAEVYQTPPMVPTPEDVPLMLPDSLNPRYSYGGSKLVSELIAFNYGKDFFEKVQVFRPHNVYGPDMGWKHVIPQFVERAINLKAQHGLTAPFEIQGSGLETRGFAYVDDVVDGIITMYANGGHREVYHIGNDEEVTIVDVAHQVATALGMTFDIRNGAEALGGTPRRCPDISKMRALGYDPKIGLTEGVQRTAVWYEANIADKPSNPLL
jgi:UDP-glucose 4-epimerase